MYVVAVVVDGIDCIAQGMILAKTEVMSRLPLRMRDSRESSRRKSLTKNFGKGYGSATNIIHKRPSERPCEYLFLSLALVTVNRETGGHFWIMLATTTPRQTHHDPNLVVWPKSKFQVRHRFGVWVCGREGVRMVW